MNAPPTSTPPTSTPQAAPKPVVHKIDPVEACILALTAAKGPGKSISPSDVARALRPGADEGAAAAGWQAMMTPVRNAAVRLARAGRIDILRKGKPVALDEIRGVIRLRTHIADDAAAAGDAE